MSRSSITVLVISLPFAAIVIIFSLSYRYMRGTNLHGLSAAFLPIAAVPVFIAWQNSAYQVVQGFRAMALSGQGGLLASVTEIILASKPLRPARAPL